MAIMIMIMINNNVDDIGEDFIDDPTANLVDDDYVDDTNHAKALHLGNSREVTRD